MRRILQVGQRTIRPGQMRGKGCASGEAKQADATTHADGEKAPPAADVDGLCRLAATGLRATRKTDYEGGLDMDVDEFNATAHGPLVPNEYPRLSPAVIGAGVVEGPVSGGSTITGAPAGSPRPSCRPACASRPRSPR